MSFSIVTAQENERFWKLNNAMVRAQGPAFLEHDRMVATYWLHLDEAFPAHQFCLVEEESGITVGVGNSIPLAFDGAWADLPSGGLDLALEKGFQDRETGKRPTIVSALYIEVAGSHRGQNLSARMIATMRQLAREQGFSRLIAPVRPSLKSRYPLIPIDAYSQWQNSAGLPFDPWLRVHIHAGGKIVQPCSKAMSVKGSAEEWEAWVGMQFPTDGDYTIPYGLVPMSIRGGKGSYVEPGIWALHEI